MKQKLRFQTEKNKIIKNVLYRIQAPLFRIWQISEGKILETNGTEK